MKVAQIGCGGIGRRRAEAVTSVPGLELSLCVDVVAMAAQELADRWNCQASTEWGDAISRPDIEIVVVSTPNGLHNPISVAALEAGKHVLCEKPLARNPQEAKQMVEAARASGRELRTGFKTTNLWDIAPMEDNGFGLFRTSDNRVASLHSSWTQWKGYLYLELFGTDGYLTINYDPAEVSLVRRSTPHQIEHFEFPAQTDTWTQEVRELVKAIEGESALSATGYDGLRAVEMAYAVYESSKQGTVVSL